jgi:hypothetical protein
VGKTNVGMFLLCGRYVWGGKMLKVENQGEKLVINEKLVTSGRQYGGGKLTWKKSLCGGEYVCRMKRWFKVESWYLWKTGDRWEIA